MNYTLTIIMSNYNQAQYIEKAIESVLMQKVSFAYQLLITDDFSTKDNSVEIIKQYELKYPEKIKVLYNKENGRYLKNILRAKELTKTPYFCLLDADDYWTDEDFLQRAYDFLNNNLDYVIYQENVCCLYPDKTTKNFVSKDIEPIGFDLDDYIAGKSVITQTTGQFYRNTIFINGIPDIIRDAIGTYSERSFEGDYDRLVMHLKYGRAYYNNITCGVYRILPNAGIWAKLNKIEKKVLTMQTYYDYNRYFENVYEKYFVTNMFNMMQELCDDIKESILSFEYESISDTYINQFHILYKYLKGKSKDIQLRKVNNSAINISGKVLIKLLIKKILTRLSIREGKS